MWLINTHTLELKEFSGGSPPPYAILSHTWDDDEVLFRDIINGVSYASKQKSGYTKIRQACRIATDDGLAYVWVDTCCIDKSSSAELSEAVNSMFQWYERSAVCYAYLPDLAPDSDFDSAFARCRWVRRGWTLQEMIAPSQLRFYDSHWLFRGTKSTEVHTISAVTRVPTDCLLQLEEMKFAPVAEKMRWASRRETTRTEDIAYCLLGLFDINMPLLYGEGSKAFIRLQEEIIRRTNDLSIFAWPAPASSGQCCGVYADSPSVFGFSTRWDHGVRNYEFSVTNKGIRITTQLFVSSDPPHFLLRLASHANSEAVFLVLQKLNQDRFVRDNTISKGIRIRHYASNIKLLPSQTIYLMDSKSPGISLIDVLWIHMSNGIQIELRDDFKMFGVEPPSVWDPAHSFLQSQSQTVALEIGSSSAPYGSLAILIFYEQYKDTPMAVYLLPASSQALPWVLANLSTLTKADLIKYWGLSHVWHYIPQVWKQEYDSEHIWSISAGGSNLQLIAKADQANVQRLRLSRLSIGAESSAFQGYEGSITHVVNEQAQYKYRMHH